MAARFPTRLEEFCEYFEIPFFKLNLHCLFCNSSCSLEDLAAFATRDLSLVWKGYHCFATCKSCIFSAAAVEFHNFLRCSVDAAHIEGITGVPLSCILCRCRCCLKVLSNSEKIACVGRSERLHLVRVTWRGTCSDCVNRI